MSEKVIGQDIDTGQPWATVYPEAIVTTVRMHGDEPMAQAIRAYSAAAVNYFDLAVEEGSRYVDADPNRIWSDLEHAAGAGADRARRMLELLQRHPLAAEGTLLDIHNTYTETPPFVIVPEDHLFDTSDEGRTMATRRLLAQIGLRHVVTLPSEMTTDMLIGRNDLFTTAKALIEWPLPFTAAQLEHGAAALEKVSRNYRPSPGFLMAVHRVTDVIEVGEVLDGAQNFEWHESSSGGFVPILYDHPEAAAAGTYTADEQATIWGYKATEVYPLIGA